MEENNEMMTRNTEDMTDARETELHVAEAQPDDAAEVQVVEAEPVEAQAVQAADEQQPDGMTGMHVTEEQSSEEEPQNPETPRMQDPGVQKMQDQGAPQMQNPYANHYPGWEPIGPDPYHGYKQGGIPLYGYRDPVYGAYYGPGAPMRGPMPPYMGNEPKPEKEKHRIRKAHPLAFKIIDAIVFGLIAAAVFIGCNYLYRYFFPKQAEEYSVVQIGTDSKSEKADAVRTADTIETVISATPDVSEIVEKVAPAIVQIDCMFNTTSYFGSYQTPGAGSGIVIKKTDKELLIATNNHVVEGAVTIKITFTDGTTAQAVIKGTDSVADLAVVSVDLSTLDKSFADSVTVAKLGSSDDVRVGQLAIAIGNAMGYGQSTTVGYISAKDRKVKVDGTEMILIQTDAAINPGNSGGALINVSGEVIGINSVKFASAQVEGMGFAIPISRAQKILDELGNRESLSHEEKGYLGVHVQTVTTAIAQAYNWPIGVRVAEVDEGLAAEKAGIELGDIITKVNAVTVSTTTDLKTAISSYRAGSKITVTVQRLIDNAFEEIDIEVVLGNEPEEDEPAGETPAAQPESEESGEESSEEKAEDPDAPKASPKDGLPEYPSNDEQYNSGNLPDYFDPFKDFEDMFPGYSW